LYTTSEPNLYKAGYFSPDWRLASRFSMGSRGL